LWQISVRPSSSQRTFQKAGVAEKIASRRRVDEGCRSGALRPADQYSLWPTRTTTL
jgi:hypothetical protein